jgi:hypothetical protein
MSVKGQIIGGEFDKIIVRQKKNESIELGELMIATSGYDKALLQVKDISYGSQISRTNLELMSGMKLEDEDENDLEIYEPELRLYKLAELKSLLTIKSNPNLAFESKKLPNFFSEVREVVADDLNFLTIPVNPLYIGNLRSGSKEIDVPINLVGEKVFTEHILIPATTGRGKSNLTKCLIWDSIDKEYCGLLVLDPHDEYYGRNELGMKDHPKSGNIRFYSLNPTPGTSTLKISLKSISPWHFNGVFNWSDAQKEALIAYHKAYKNKWVEAIAYEKEIKGFMEGTIGVLKRRIMSILNLTIENNEIKSKGVFSTTFGESTITNIINELEKGKTVILDTSTFSGPSEILIGSIISSNILARYKKYKTNGTLSDKPVISIVLEEAPRVLGKEVLEKGSNIFATIAREGRKFKVGLLAITQLPSLIPRQILANMNTKIILGIEMAPERQAIIDSASQDLSTDSKAIASLDKGEAIITSNFTKFAVPVKIPLFKRFAEKTQNEFVKEKYITDAKKDYSGIDIN